MGLLYLLILAIFAHDVGIEWLCITGRSLLLDLEVVLVQLIHIADFLSLVLEGNACLIAIVGQRIVTILLLLLVATVRLLLNLVIASHLLLLLLLLLIHVLLMVLLLLAELDVYELLNIASSLLRLSIGWILRTYSWVVVSEIET